MIDCALKHIAVLGQVNLHFFLLTGAFAHLI